MADPIVVMMERCRNANAVGIHHLLESSHVEAIEAFKVALNIAKNVVGFFVEQQEPHRHGRGRQEEQESPMATRRMAHRESSPKRSCFPTRQRPVVDDDDSSMMTDVEDAEQEEQETARKYSSGARGSRSVDHIQDVWWEGTTTEEDPSTVTTTTNSMANSLLDSALPEEQGDFEDPQQEDYFSSVLNLYRVPLELAEFASFSSRRAALELSVAIIFNMALSRHLLALDEKACCLLLQDRDTVLQQALSLYELAYMVSNKEEDEEDTTYHEILSTEMTMAIANNMGHIYTVLGHHEEAARCFCQLLTTILWVQQEHQVLLSSSAGGGHHHQVDVEAIQVFVRSVAHLILINGSVAPAA